jgi:hypothetical protein
MFKASYKQRNTQKKMVIALSLIFLVVCDINVQFCLEYQVVTRTMTYMSRLHHQKSLFDMSIEELMEVTVISES